MNPSFYLTGRNSRVKAPVVTLVEHLRFTEILNKLESEEILTKRFL